MTLLERVSRHVRITATNYQRRPSPPFVTLFINSICNQKCEHCFYWQQLNQRDDLTKDELFALSRSMGRIENLNLSGGEPFLRPEFGEICRQFIQHNKVRQIYVPTNGYFTDRTVKQITETLKEESLHLFVAELSLDGTEAFHNNFRGSPGSFKKAMQTYDALAEIQKRDPRLRIHAISTATKDSVDEIRQLTTYLYERCPQMDHHNLAFIRGERRNHALEEPDHNAYQSLYNYFQRLWAPRERRRYGAIVEPMAQWVNTHPLAEKTQVVPCRAGILNAVIYANGDVAVCEDHKPLGNLRQNSFPEIWNSPEAVSLRERIANKQCHCSNAVYLWPSIVYQPVQLLRAFVGAKAWRSASPLSDGERASCSVRTPTEALVNITQAGGKA